MSTTPDELTEFVKASLTGGVPREQIDAALRKAGWTIDQTRAALASFAESDFPIPVRGRGHTWMRARRSCISCCFRRST
jgi:type I site-specific restriction endonuclease